MCSPPMENFFYKFNYLFKFCPFSTKKICVEFHQNNIFLMKFYIFCKRVGKF